jgi:hypothetical protein
VDDTADDHRPDTAVTVRTKPFKSNAGTVADGADTNGARRSGAAELQPVLTTLRTVHGCRRIACTTALQCLAKAVEYGDLAKTPTSSNQKRDFQELEQRVFQELEQRFTVLAVLADNEQVLADESKSLSGRCAGFHAKRRSAMSCGLPYGRCSQSSPIFGTCS